MPQRSLYENIDITTDDGVILATQTGVPRLPLSGHNVFRDMVRYINFLSGVADPGKL